MVGVAKSNEVQHCSMYGMADVWRTVCTATRPPCHACYNTEPRSAPRACMAWLNVFWLGFYTRGRKAWAVVPCERKGHAPPVAEG